MSPTRRGTRLILLLFVLLCFAGLQTATAIDLHPHQHAGPHQHCCGICHAGHLPALQSGDTCPLAPPTELESRGAAPEAASQGDSPADFHLSRAPPATV